MSYLVTGIFIALDFVTGIINAIKSKTFTSSIMRDGLFHKCGSIICIAFGVLVDYAQLYLDLGINVPVANAICIYIVLMECGSIIENIGQINPQIIPEKIKEHFGKLN